MKMESPKPTCKASNGGLKQMGEKMKGKVESGCMQTREGEKGLMVLGWFKWEFSGFCI